MVEQETLILEQERIRREYQRRADEIPSDRYSAWDRTENFIVAERKAVAASELHRLARFPVAGDRCLEIGYGKVGWLGDLIGWGLRETDLYGMELDESRASVAHEALPNANLRIGDATHLPWPDSYFKIIIASTVFSSILDQKMRKLLAVELVRVLASDGAILWYDMSRNNPRNRSVSGITREDIAELFPSLSLHVRSITLAPPLARMIVPRSLTAASFLAAIPVLRTHLLGVLVRKEVSSK